MIEFSSSILSSKKVLLFAVVVALLLLSWCAFIVLRWFEKKKKKKKKKGPPKRARGRNFGGVDATTTRGKKRTDTNIIDIIKIADVRARVFHRQKTVRAERTDDEGRGKDVE